MAMPLDNDRNSCQVFSPDDIYPVAAGEVDVQGLSVVMFDVDIVYTLVDGGSGMELAAGDPLGVMQRNSLWIDKAATMAVMKGPRK